ncbi:hypothetical protein H0H93_004395, partial [Arthromyces matolae]
IDDDGRARMAPRTRPPTPPLDTRPVSPPRNPPTPPRQPTPPPRRPSPPPRRLTPPPRRFTPPRRRPASPPRRPSSPARNYRTRESSYRERRRSPPHRPSRSPIRYRSRSPPRRVGPAPSRPPVALSKGKQRADEPTLADDFNLAQLLQRLEVAGHCVPADAEVLQDPLAIDIISGLLDEVDLLKRQRKQTLSTLSRAEKRRASTPEEDTSEVKRPRWYEDEATEPHPHKSTSTQPSVRTDSPLPMSDTSATPSVATTRLSASSYTTPAGPNRSRSPGPSSSSSGLLAPPQVSSSTTSGLAASMHAPQPRRRREKKVVDESTLDPVTFPAEVPANAGPGVLKFFPEVSVPAPPAVFPKATPTPDTRSSYELGETSIAGDHSDEDISDAPDNQQTRQSARKRQEIQTGRIPDIIGVFHQPGGKIERNNAAFIGGLTSSFHHSTRSNIIFFGYDANAARRYEEHSRQNYRPPDTETYKIAPNGFPMNPFELRGLYNHVNNTRSRRSDRYIAYRLLLEFRRWSMIMEPSGRDRTMSLIVDVNLYPPLANPVSAADEPTWAIVEEIPRGLTYHRSDGSIAFTDMKPLDPDDPFNINLSSRYSVIYGRPGRPGAFQGLVFDQAYQLNIRSWVGYSVIRALCPNNESRTALIRRLAYVAARPHFYQEAVDSYNTHHPNAPFVPLFVTDGRIRFHRVYVPIGNRHNFSDHDALRVLLRNHIPVEWIDHAYLFGKAYLDYHFEHPSMLTDEFVQIDNERITRLNQYGTPPAIPEWDGWRQLTPNDRSRLLGAYLILAFCQSYNVYTQNPNTGLIYI